MPEGSRPRFDIFSPGVGLVAIGAGLLSLAVVEGAQLVLRVASSERAAAASPEPRVIAAPPVPSLGAFVPASPFAVEADSPESDAAMQDSVAVGRGAPRPAGAPSGQLIGVAAAPMPNGLAIFRLYSSGAVEAMISTEDNRWSAWVPVGPGLSTDMKRPAAEAGSGNPDTENNP